MVTTIRTSTVYGLTAVPVDIEVIVRPQGTERFVIVGLADGAVRESSERVGAAIRSSGFFVPDHVLVNLAPAELRKEGSAFDLPMALGVIIASGQIEPLDLRHRFFVGELSLDGSLKATRGIVSFAIEALAQGATEVVVPAENAAEARLIAGLRVISAHSLREVVSYLCGQKRSEPPTEMAPAEEQNAALQLRVSDVWGQEAAKRALVIAAAGGHNVLFVGPPGCGKSMLARRFPSLLPALTPEEVLEVARIHSIAGLPLHSILQGIRPYRAPHHVISDAGLVGGGSTPRPGEISLSHRGVLFLDEFPEFRRSALETLRAPLEHGEVTISRAKMAVTFPADFQLIAAMNPCPCGRLGVEGANCSCSRVKIHSYLQRLSQPILDRIDLHVELQAVPLAVMGPTRAGTEAATTEAALRSIIVDAQAIQIQRAQKRNAALSSEELFRSAELSPGVRKLLERLSTGKALSARGVTRILKVARTIADLAGDATLVERHVAEAINFRALDRIQSYCQGEPSVRRGAAA